MYEDAGCKNPCGQEPLVCGECSESRTFRGMMIKNWPDTEMYIEQEFLEEDERFSINRETRFLVKELVF